SELARAAEIMQAPSLKLATAVAGTQSHAKELKKQLSGGKAPEPLTHGGYASPPTGTTYDVLRQTLQDTARLLNVTLFDVAERVQGIVAEQARLEAEIERMGAAGDLSAESLLETANQIGDAAVVIQEIPGGNPNLMRQLIDQIRKKVEPSAVFLTTAQSDSKVMLVAGVSRDLVNKGISAGNWVKAVAPIVGGGGGGKPDMAQAGGKDATALPQAMEAAQTFIEEALRA
ncbi:MAG: DHHA1 domain-containing protein, partial [Planctomycetota bacterium]